MIQTDPINPNHQLPLEKIFTTLTVKELDKTSEKKIEIDYSDLLKTAINGFLPKRLLIEGEGGAGKTTLCAKIVWDWIKGINFTEFKMVLVIRLWDSAHRTMGGNCQIISVWQQFRPAYTAWSVHPLQPWQGFNNLGWVGWVPGGSPDAMWSHPDCCHEAIQIYQSHSHISIVESRSNPLHTQSQQGLCIHICGGIH